MMRWVATAAAIAAGVLLMAAPAHAAVSVKVQPLLYRDSIAEGGTKSGYVDVSNPNDAPTAFRFSVRAFRQIDDDGTLQFYDNEQISSGVKLDVTEAELQPKDVLRLHFVLDGAKLPSGDVFFAIMAAAEQPSGEGASISVQAGTLFVLSNGTASSHNAEITDFSAPLFQFDDKIQAQLSVKNTAQEGQATGFFPTIQFSAWPYIAKEVSGPLVFAGRTRAVSLVYPGNYVGVVWMKVGAGTNEKTAVSIVVTGWYRWAIPAALTGLILLMYLLLHIRRRRRKGSKG